MIKELLLSTSFEDNKLAVNILRAKGYPNHQIMYIVNETLTSEYQPFISKSYFVEIYVSCRNKEYYERYQRYLDIFRENLMI